MFAHKSRPENSRRVRLIMTPALHAA